MHQNLPTNMFLSGRNYNGGRMLSVCNQPTKTKCQTIYTTKLKPSIKNGSIYDNEGMDMPNYNYTNWYPMTRPIKHYRKTGTTNTKVNSNCCISYQIGDEYKNLGKNTEGVNKLLNPLNMDNGCKIYDPTRSIHFEHFKAKGNVINFNGMSNIKTGVAPLSKKFYQNYSKYLYSRGNTYQQKNSINKIPGIKYYENGYPVYPDISQSTTSDIPLNSSYYYSNSVLTDNNVTDSSNCNLVIYKPSNHQFSVQGAVDSGTRLERLKYNTITTNNGTFYRDTLGSINISYSPDPIFFIKNKFSLPKAFNIHKSKTICNCIT